MLTQSREWIVAAALTIVTAWPICVVAQDTVQGAQSDGRPRPSRNGGTVVRDREGIPHITARTEREAIYLQGFTHAQDRLFQMDVTRRTADGTLAELLGPDALPSDVQLRTFGLRRAAERSLPILSSSVRELLSAYADGVNDYAAGHPLPPEYATLEITTFRPWVPADSVSVIKAISFGLSFELSDLDRSTLLGQLQAAGNTEGFNGTALFFEDVNRLAPFDSAATVPDASASGSKSARAGADMLKFAASPAIKDKVLLESARSYLAQLRSMPLVQSVVRGPDDERGSNEFVIAGTHTRTGRPLLANDPHLTLTAPATFYQNEIRTPGFSVIGGSLPGAPYVIIGNNERLAWGLTTHFMDVTDVYREQIVADPNSPSGLSTMYQGTLEPVLQLPQVFRANAVGDGIQNNVAAVPAGGRIPAALLIVPRRNNGPIITLNQAEGTAISVQFAGFSGTREIQAFRGINRARNLNQFTAALQSFDVGSQNFIYADRGGNIAYFATGEVPLREDLENGEPVGAPPFLIRDGRGGNEWMPPQDDDPDRALPFAILPFKEMPQLINPPRGFIVNANNDPSGNSRDNNALNVMRPTGGIRYIGSGYNFDLGIRAGRIDRLLTSLLANGRKVGVEELQRVQSDVVMGDAIFFVPFIERALGNAQRPGAPAALASLAGDPRIVEAVARFGVWDRSTPTGIVEGFDASDENGTRAEPEAGEIANSVAASIYSVWRNQFVSQTLGATLSKRGVTINSPRDIQLTAVKNLFDNFPQRMGVGVSGVDFFEVPGVSSAADRRDIVLLRSLSKALDLLAGSTFADAFNGSTNQSDYRWGRLHRTVLAHPIGGALSIPPAGGAFPPSLPNLPGVAIDGGLHTVDQGTHRIDRDNANGFMFMFAPALRYVASVDQKGITSVSSLPGGQSGVPGSPFYLNLLGRWLTNEAFPLRTDAVDRRDDESDADKDRSDAGGQKGPRPDPK